MPKNDVLTQLDNDPESFSMSELSDELKDDADILLSAVRSTFDAASKELFYYTISLAIAKS